MLAERQQPRAAAAGADGCRRPQRPGSGAGGPAGHADAGRGLAIPQQHATRQVCVRRCLVILDQTEASGCGLGLKPGHDNRWRTSTKRGTRECEVESIFCCCGSLEAQRSLNDCRYALNWLKLRAWGLTDWDALLMLDADTTVVSDVRGLFQLPADFAVALDEDKRARRCAAALHESSCAAGYFLMGRGPQSSIKFRQTRQVRCRV